MTPAEQGASSNGRSTTTLIGVASTALGPVMFAIGRDITGSYGVAATWFALIPLAVAASAATMKPLPVDTRHSEPSWVPAHVG